MPAHLDADAPEVLVLNPQERMGADGTLWTYTDKAVRVASPKALDQLATLMLSRSPDKGDLIVHEASIRRDGEAIDLLAGGKTLKDTALAGHADVAEALPATPLRVGFGRVRVEWAGKAQWHALGKDLAPRPWHAGGFGGIEITLRVAKQPEMPKDAPARFQTPPVIEASTFADWADVSRTMAPLYATDGPIAPGSPLAAVLAEVKAVPTPMARTALALRHVQDDVRYLALSMGSGNYVPQKRCAPAGGRRGHSGHRDRPARARGCHPADHPCLAAAGHRRFRRRARGLYRGAGGRSRCRDICEPRAGAQKARGIDPASAAANWLTAHMMAETGDLAGATALLDRRIALGGDVRDAYRSAKADLLGQYGDPQAALALLDDLIADTPGNPELLNARCWIKATQQLALDTALKDCTSAIELSSQTYAALDSRALVWFRMGRYAEALADLNAVLAKAPGLAQSLFVRGVIEMKQGDKTKAAADLATARRIDPQIDHFHARFGIHPDA